MWRLDELTYNEVVEGSSPKLGRITYVTKMMSERQVKISRERIIPYIHFCASGMQGNDVDLIIILCSGEFPEFKVKRL